jgi:hypothetical protein
VQMVSRHIWWDLLKEVDTLHNQEVQGSPKALFQAERLEITRPPPKVGCGYLTAFIRTSLNSIFSWRSNMTTCSLPALIHPYLTSLLPCSPQSSPSSSPR